MPTQTFIPVRPRSPVTASTRTATASICWPMGAMEAAAILTPPDIFSQLAMAIPVSLLYITSVLAAMIAGVVAAIYPARRAARLNPIDALRFE